MTSLPGADERRIARMLRRRGVGPDADPPMPYQMEARWNAAVAAEQAGTTEEGPERDWLDDILDADTPEPAEETDRLKPEPTSPKTPAKPKKSQASKARQARKRKRQRAKRRNPDTPRSAWDTEPRSPKQSLLDAWAAVPYRFKWLLHHAAAAGIGWKAGLVAWSTDAAAWFAAGRWMTLSAFVLYGLGICVIALYRRTRHWAWPAALLAAVPASSFVVGVLLYGTGYHH